MQIPVYGPLLGQAAACEPILRALPEWFGIEQAIQQYACEIAQLPTFLASLDGRAAGFVTIKQHNPYAAEILVMGVRPHLHRHGIGRALLARAEVFLRQNGAEYLQVKTLAPSRPSEHYERTRAFYLACGFRPLEELPHLWDADNPCLLMVKCLREHAPQV